MLTNLSHLPSLFVMVDIETLGIGPRSVVTQIAAVPYELTKAQPRKAEDDEELESVNVDPTREAPRQVFNRFLPAQAQLRGHNPRGVDASTLSFWLDQPPEAQVGLKRSLDADSSILGILPILQDFRSYVLGVARGYGKSDWGVITRGPQFDLVNIESLLSDYGIPCPWEYHQVWDLRTIVNLLDMSSSDTPKPRGFVAHDAYWDSVWQIRQMQGAIDLLESDFTEEGAEASGPGTLNLNPQKKLPIS